MLDDDSSQALTYEEYSAMLTYIIVRILYDVADQIFRMSIHVSLTSALRCARIIRHG